MVAGLLFEDNYMGLDKQLELDIKDAILSVIEKRVDNGNPPDRREMSLILINYAARWLTKDILE